MVPVGELHFVPLASVVCCGTSLVGMPSCTPVGASVTIFQPAFSRRRRPVSASAPRSFGLSTPVGLPPLAFWNSLIDSTIRSLTSPEIAPLYWPTQARSDWIASRSPWPIAPAVSAGDCRAGRIGTVVTCFGLTAGGVVVWACAEAAAATNINVEVSIDLMTTTLTSIDAAPIKHICWVETNGPAVHGRAKVSLGHAEF